jgi:hypothetical protein
MQIGATGFEPVTSSQEYPKSEGLPKDAARNPAHPAHEGQKSDTPIDPDLARVVAAWKKLPEPIKAGILAMVGAAII